MGQSESKKTGVSEIGGQHSQDIPDESDSNDAQDANFSEKLESSAPVKRSIAARLKESWKTKKRLEKEECDDASKSSTEEPDPQNILLDGVTKDERVNNISVSSLKPGVLNEERSGYSNPTHSLIKQHFSSEVAVSDEGAGQLRSGGNEEPNSKRSIEGPSSFGDESLERAVSVLSECEKIDVKKLIESLETPMKWLSEIGDSQTFMECPDSMSDGNEVNSGRNLLRKQDHFRIATYRMWLSARRFLQESDQRQALEDLFQSKSAMNRFSDCIAYRGRGNEWSREAQRGDKDVEKALRMTIDGSHAFIMFHIGNRSDAERLLQTVQGQTMTTGLQAAITGIHAAVVACQKSQLPLAIQIAREAEAMDPKYWRWHSLVAVLLQHLPITHNPSVASTRRREMFAAMEETCRLESRNSKRAQLLAEAYQNAAFHVRSKKETLVDEDYRMYARRAIHYYILAMDCVPKCALTHARVTRSLWNLRKLNEDAAIRALGVADKTMRILVGGGMSMDLDDDSQDEALEKIAEAAMLLGLFWESIGNFDRALSVFRMAVTNPMANSNVAYRSELGLIVVNFQKGKSSGKQNPCKSPNVDVVGELERLMDKYSDSHLQQQTFCHMGHYLLDIKKDRNSALDSFCKAISINPESGFLRRYYPRFSPSNSRSLNIGDLVHDLACEELAMVQVSAKRGSPEAVKRAAILNEQIEKAQKIIQSQFAEFAHLKNGWKRNAWSKNAKGNDDALSVNSQGGDGGVKNEDSKVDPEAEQSPPNDGIVSNDEVCCNSDEKLEIGDAGSEGISGASDFVFETMI